MDKYEKTDRFAVRADDYDETLYRLRYVDAMADEILKNISPSPEMTLIDFGAGTGLLTERIAPYVGKIVAIDISPSMIDKLRAKEADLPCELEILPIDLSREPYPGDSVDGIVSTMTLHHIRDTEAILKRLYDAIIPGGFLALCDVDTEDGSFHTVDTGVEHFGFDREELRKKAEAAGFVNVRLADAAVIRKPQGEYPAFLLYAEKPRS